jgi:hypothetical protein
MERCAIVLVYAVTCNEQEEALYLRGARIAYLKLFMGYFTILFTFGSRGAASLHHHRNG